MTNIKLLDHQTIEKIAAGEVIERPASIVKELVENSLDAASKNIIIEIKDGGKSYIRVTDDGIGIDSEDLELAFKRHSTSKITSLEDLYSITSLGFRGEALSSVSHVAKIDVMTKTDGCLSGIHASVEEGEILSKEIIGTPKGTTMIVKDLFYNLPVRKKFLKSTLSESNQIIDIVYKIALGNRDVSFKLIKDNKVILKTSRRNNPLEHIYSVLGKDFKENLIDINMSNEIFNINGYISNNKLYRSNRSHQYIYVNGRYINSKSINDLVEKNYKSIIPINRFPVFILFIHIDPKAIDINIHPNKQEIRFVDEKTIFEDMSELVKAKLSDSISIPELSFNKRKAKDKNKEKIPTLFDSPAIEVESEKDIIVKDFTSINNKAYIDKSPNNNDTSDYTINKKHKDFLIGEDSLESMPLEVRSEDCESYSYKDQKLDTKNILTDLKPLGVIFKTYILAEDKLNQKLYFIDQHAAHERVMYEKYLDEFNKESINSQQLISPEVIELTNLEMNKFTNNIDVFKSLGFDVDEFGKNNVAIRAVPLVFGKPDIKKLFYDILDNMENNISSSYDMHIDKIMKIACTKAIKSGDSMSDIEILSLFEDLKNTNEPNSCPHGRPTILEMTKKDIEKGFLRIM